MQGDLACHSPAGYPDCPPPPPHPMTTLQAACSTEHQNHLWLCDALGAPVFLSCLFRDSVSHQQPRSLLPPLRFPALPACHTFREADEQADMTTAFSLPSAMATTFQNLNVLTSRVGELMCSVSCLVTEPGGGGQPRCLAANGSTQVTRFPSCSMRTKHDSLEVGGTRQPPPSCQRQHIRHQAGKL